MDKPDPANTTPSTSNGPARSKGARLAEDAARKRARAKQKRLLTLLLAVLVLNGLLAYHLYGTMVTDAQQQRLQQVSAQEAAARAGVVEDYLGELNQLLQHAAEQDRVQQALSQGDQLSLDRLAQRIVDRFPQARAARLTPLGLTQMDRDSDVPIRFAELDLLRRAERREPALPEVITVGEQRLLHLVTPIPADAEQPVAGTLLVSLDADYLADAVKARDPSQGLTELLQQFPDSREQTLHQSGTGNAGSPREHPVRNSHWRVRFTPSQILYQQSQELPILWLVVVSASVAVSLMLTWLLSKLSSRPLGRRKIPLSAGDQQDQDEDPIAILKRRRQDALDITVIDEDEDILGIQKSTGKQKASGAGDGAEAASTPEEVPEEIFRANDIRGLAGSQLTPQLATHIGQALGSEALDQGESSIIVARDGRTHSGELCQQLITGILNSGCQVIDIGVVPTPLLYFATFHFDDTSSGVMVTASHNPAEYNGFKIVINGATLAGDAILDIRTRIQRGDYHRGDGDIESREIVADYIDRILSDVALAGDISMVIDAGNAVTGTLAPQLFEELGCTVTPLYCDIDGTFPNHDPDPTQEKNLGDLIAKVQEVGADVGVAFDGDGDRLVVVTASGNIIWPDRLLMLFAKDVLARNPGADVLYDVKCSRQLNQLITSYGGRPIIWKTGHSPMKSKMIETGALIGGEYSGHIFIKDRWYGFDDGMYAMARLLEIVTLRDQSVDDVFASFPMLPSTPELKIPVSDEEKFSLVQKLVDQGTFTGGKATTIDGLRVDFGKGWGLVRASNTSPALTLRFEAEDEESLKKIMALFKQQLLKVDSKLNIDF